MELNRSVYDISSAFPQIASFPVYDRPDKRVAVLVRLFTHGDNRASAKYVHMALWGMRSHMLNSDMRDYQPTVVFHVDSAFNDWVQPILTAAGVPRENVIVYPSEMLKPQRLGHIYHKAVAPLVDTQLDQFERVIILDADTFSLSNEASGPVPLMDMSLNAMPADEIMLLRGWVTGEVSKRPYSGWFHHVGGAEEFYQKAASYCNTTVATIKHICFPENPLQTPHVEFNGAYINIPISILNPELREFIHDVSADMGNEEIALVVWAMKEYIETGKYLPSVTMEGYAHSHPAFDVSWSFDFARAQVKRGIPVWAHCNEYNHILDYAFDFAKEVHATDEEACNFRDAIIAGIKSIQIS